jgi:hypothetical protein
LIFIDDGSDDGTKESLTEGCGFPDCELTGELNSIKCLI